VPGYFYSWSVSAAIHYVQCIIPRAFQSLKLHSVVNVGVQSGGKLLGSFAVRFWWWGVSQVWQRRWTSRVAFYNSQSPRRNIKVGPTMIPKITAKKGLWNSRDGNEAVESVCVSGPTLKADVSCLQWIDHAAQATMDYRLELRRYACHVFEEPLNLSTFSWSLPITQGLFSIGCQVKWRMRSPDASSYWFAVTMGCFGLLLTQLTWIRLWITSVRCVRYNSIWCLPYLL